MFPLGALRENNPCTLNIGGTKINYLSKKFSMPYKLLKDKLNIIMVSKTKKDNTFLTCKYFLQRQFSIKPVFMMMIYFCILWKASQ